MRKHPTRRLSYTPHTPGISTAWLLALSALVPGCRWEGPSAHTPETGDDAGHTMDDRPRPEHPQIAIEVGPHTFNARVAGPEDGEVVFLLHGFPETSYEWRHVLGALGAAGFRAVAPDQRGYSPLARPDDVQDYATAALVGDLLGMADALGATRFHLVGHDWGAIVAWAAASRAAPRVRSLTAVSTAHPTALGAELARPDSCQARASAHFLLRKAPDAAARLLANDAEGLRAEYADLPKRAVHEYLSVLGEEPALRAALHWYGANIAPAEPPPPLGPVPVPTLYVLGDEDPTNCLEPEAAHAQLVTGRYTFRLFPGVDHWLPERAPRKFTRLLLAHLDSAREESDK